MRFDEGTFGPHLRRERERRGITLDDIAGRTKIARSMLAKLERGDLAGWPAGIFRRSFFRDYANAIGLDADALLDEFLRLYPDPAAKAPAACEAPRSPASDLRLMLAVADAGGIARGRLFRALVDTAGILALAAVVSAVVGHLAVLAATFALVYHATTILRRDCTLGALLTLRFGARAETAPPAPRQATAPRIVDLARSQHGRRPRLHRRVADSSRPAAG